MGEEHLSSLAFRHRRAARARLVGLAVFFASVPGVAAAAQFERTLPLRSVVLPSVNAAHLAPGWNLGNSLEAYAGGTLPKTSSQETFWGNPPVDQAIMNGIAAAGFKSVRIPVAWGQYADRNNVIAPFWLTRVRQVVDEARRAGLYVILNEHWDGGWLQPTYNARMVASPKLAALWMQIATYFRYYDQHLIFAGTNEVMVNGQYGAPTIENCTVQNGFNQMFVSAVRKTGGNNATRSLVVQTYNTNIDFGMSCNRAMPTDTAFRRLMVEVHYYDPYDFTLN